MSGSGIGDILRQARERAATNGPGEPPAEDEADEFHCYAKLRGLRQVAFMLELRLTGGDSDAFDYGMLVRARFNPSSGLVVQFTNGTVSLRGKHLRPVYEGILAHRVPWVAVAANAAAAARDPEATVVTGIEVEEIR